MNEGLKKLVLKIFGESTIGFLEFFLRPKLKSGQGKPFNGQAFRQKIFLELTRSFPFQAIVETGTYMGSTAEFMHSTARLPIYTVEVNPRFFGYAKARFLGNRDIHLSLGDSRKILNEFAARKFLSGKQLFFYLDAHWYNELPLAEELRTIFLHWPDAVVMIDDFQVPDDSGYGFDDYGEGKKLSPDYLPKINGADLAKFFPSAGSASETGAKRGCVVLALSAENAEKLRSLQCLRG
ncbi:MAG: hypothetical protein AAB871_01975 [Patescibacteria group bacterium]